MSTPFDMPFCPRGILPHPTFSDMSAGHKRVPKSEGYLNRTFLGAKKEGTKGEVKRGEAVPECTGPEGERGGRNEGKRVGGKGSESTLEKL